MKLSKYKNAIFYISTILLFSILIVVVIKSGEKLEPSGLQLNKNVDGSLANAFIDSAKANFTHPLSILLLQIISIILIARILGYLCKKIGQPTVIGEILAGILFGPSLLGLYFPEITQILFPANSLNNLQFLSQIGLIFFMFVIGMEIDLNILRKKAQDAILISHASIIIPFSLGIGLAYFLYSSFASGTINFLPFALFIGISMSITAFPVLARIVQERNMQRSKIGQMVITCAAVDDITAWCLLAAVIAIVRSGTMVSSLFTILMASLYVLIMLTLIRPFLNRIGQVYRTRGQIKRPIVAIFFVTLFVSAYATEMIGIHAIFGAFMAGVIMPSNINFKNIITEKIDDVAQIVLLPLFFVITGLRTQINLLNDIELWKVCFAIIGVAIMGKFIGSSFAARYTGQNLRNSFIIGALMNTRGLMELVVLNIGLDLGVLTPQIFTMMVIMALVTTFMTGPVLYLIDIFFPDKSVHFAPDNNGFKHTKQFRILISYANPKNGIAMVRIAKSILCNGKENSKATILHFYPDNEMNQFNLIEYERKSLAPVIREAEKLYLDHDIIFKASYDINRELLATAKAGKYDLMLMGVGQSILEGSYLGKIVGFILRWFDPSKLFRKDSYLVNKLLNKKTLEVIRSAKTPIGVYIDNNLSKVQTVLISVLSSNDAILLFYAQLILNGEGINYEIVDFTGFSKTNDDFNEIKNSIEEKNSIKLNIITSSFDEIDYSKYDVMIVTIKSWDKFSKKFKSIKDEAPSVIVLNH